MAYDKQQSDTPSDKLCLYGPLAKDFMRTHVGETVKLTVTGLLTTASTKAPDSVEGDETPYVEFEVLEVDGGKKAYGDMSASEMEAQIANVKNEDQPEPQTTIPNREDGGSIWTDVKRQAKIGQTPQRRPKPFRIG
jgi:hypothetical protein